MSFAHFLRLYTPLTFQIFYCTQLLYNLFQIRTLYIDSKRRESHHHQIINVYITTIMPSLTASISAPSVMSPDIPEKGSKYATVLILRSLQHPDSSRMTKDENMAGKLNTSGTSKCTQYILSTFNRYQMQNHNILRYNIALKVFYIVLLKAISLECHTMIAICIVPSLF